MTTPRPSSVAALIASAATEHGGRDAIVDGDRVWTWRTLARAVDRVAARLAALGVRPGDRVAIQVPRSIEEVVATLAVARAGGVFVDVAPPATVGQLRHIVEDAGAEVLFVGARRARELAAEGEPGLLDRMRHVIVVAGAGAGAPGLTGPFIDWTELVETRPDAPAPPAPEEDPHATAALLYTSGSTGRPRGVEVTHGNLLAGARSVAGYLENEASDRILGLLPLSFDYGLSQLTTMALVGGTLVLQAVAMPGEILRTVRAQGVTGIAAVPTTWIALVRHLEAAGETLAGLRFVTSSGGAIPDGVLRAMPERLPGAAIHLMYGLTEAFRSTRLPPSLFAEKRGAIGRAVPDAEVFVVADGGRRLAAPGEVGELVHAGAFVARGYWRRPAETAARFRPCPAVAAARGRDEPVVWSGDLVRADDDGILWFVGRRDEQLKVSGYRLSPTEVEEIVAASDTVLEVVAFGRPDEALGQSVGIAVVGARSGTAAEMFDREALLGYCRGRMPAYMRPTLVRVHHGPFPRTGTGKVDRPAVIAWALSRAEDGDGDDA